MKLALLNFDDATAACHLAMLFFPCSTVAKTNEDADILISCRNSDTSTAVTVTDRINSVEKTVPILSSVYTVNNKDLAFSQARAFFMAACEFTTIRPPWGTLTGIRPAKLIRQLLEDGFSDEEVSKLLLEQHLISDKKLALAMSVQKNEAEILSGLIKDGASLYISIPFCPSRCSYCSFVSHSIEKAGSLIEQYVTLLTEEIKSKAELIYRRGLKLQSIYIGGGTPTILSPKQLSDIMTVIKDRFDFKYISEYTVECGRPDTITGEKLETIKSLGCDRICINPQTMNDEILKSVGRKHTKDDIIASFLLARKIGFDNINMDVIVGLPGETPQTFKSSMDSIISLAPDDVTVHTLSKKKGSKIELQQCLQHAKYADEMVDYASQKLISADYYPYYLYRQKNTLSNLENVGWCIKDKASIYNVAIMEEVQSIISCGAGGVTKIVSKDNARISRICNTKYPYEYISSFDMVIESNKTIERMIGD